MFRIILGCKYTSGHINTMAGIFSVLEERFRNLIRSPIPARSNTACPRRRTPKCTQDCRHSIYGIMSTGKISWRNEGASI